MADADKSLDVKVNTTGDDSGAKKVLASLEGIKTAAGQTTSKTEDLSDAQKKAAQHSEELELKFREFVRTMSLGGSALTEFAHGLLGLGEGPLGEMLAVATAAKLIGDYFQRLDEVASKARQAIDGFADTQSALQDSAKALDDYIDRLNNVATREEEIASALERQKAAREAIANMENQAESAEMKAEKARNAQLVSSGAITQAQADARNAQAELQQKQDADARANKLAQDNINELQQRLKEAEKQHPDLAQAASTAKNAFDLSDRLKHEAPARITQLEQRNDELEAEINRQKEIIRFQSSRAQGSDPTGAQLARAQNDLATAEAALKANADSLQRQRGYAKANISDADWKRAADALADNEKLLRTLPGQIEQAVKLAGIAQGGQAGTASADAVTQLLTLLTKNRPAPVGAGLTLGDLGDYFSAREMEAHGQTLSQAQRETLQKFAQITNDQLAHHTELGILLLKFAQSIGDSRKEIANLSQMLEAFMQGLESHHTGMLLNGSRNG
ncbi:MAG TPA: hypothetical protein VFB72_16630 [Verrucomicrobiae bacterium]|nr:hypothetical protein [Verrucomicrobiae bacterium]